MALNQLEQSQVKGLQEFIDERTEWKKPADWIDIRSGALENSIYMLVGHSADYSSYRYFSFLINMNDSSAKYKVYIDNVLYGSYAHGAVCEIDWQTLNLASGKSTNTPVSLVTHVIRVCPEDMQYSISDFYTQKHSSDSNTAAYVGLLWLHFTQNVMNKVKLSQYASPTIYSEILVAMTALDDNLHLTGSNQTGFLGNVNDRYAIRRSPYLAKLPTIEVDTLNYVGGMFNHIGPLKTARLKVNESIKISSSGNNANSSSFLSGSVEKIIINKPIIFTSTSVASQSLFRGSSLESLPACDFRNAARLSSFLTENTKLNNTILDLSEANDLKYLVANGTTSNFQSGLVGVFVSPEAPFDYATAPQINVSYTGLDRAALVALFNSLPTVSASQVCDITGATGAADLTAEDLAIATAKGWTVTR